MTTAADLRKQITAIAVELGSAAESVERVITATPDEHLAGILESFEKSRDEAAAFRARLVAAPALMRAVCPAKEWRTAADRRDVAQRAVKIMDAFASKYDGITAEVLAEVMDANDSVWASMTLHPGIDGEAHDPRITMWGKSFYGFRYRVSEAIEVVRADEIRAEAARKRAAQDAAWSRQGLARCSRCDGQGGRKEWPGFDCFDCDGRGATGKH